MPFVDFYKKHIDYYNKTVHDMLTREIPLIPPNFPKNRKKRCNYFISDWIYWIPYEGISSYLRNKIQKALKKGICGFGEPSKFRRNKIFHLEDLMVMYGMLIQTLWKINTVHKCKMQHGMKNYLWVNSVIGISSIYPRMELAIMP